MPRLPRPPLAALATALMLATPASASWLTTAPETALAVAITERSEVRFDMALFRPFEAIDAMVTGQVDAPEFDVTRWPAMVVNSGCINRFPLPARHPYFDDGFNHCLLAYL